jgi:hypothetical protein
MIFYYTTAAHDYTLGGIRVTDHPLNRQIHNVHYESLLQAGSAHVSGAGVHVFSDIERLPGFFIPKLIEYRHRLSEEYGSNVLFLNHPTRSKRRYELLTLLNRRGINQFDIYRLNEHPSPARWPVFVRRENDHQGPVSPLLHTQEELDLFHDELHQQETFTEDMVVIEFMDTSAPDGTFRKYAVTRIGDALIPRHLFISNDWVGKHKSNADKKLRMEEERVFVREFPYREEIMEVFRLAQIEHGRIDYAIHEGRIQVWEINTNPGYFAQDDAPGPDRERYRYHLKFIDEMQAAFESLEKLCR